MQLKKNYSKDIVVSVIILTYRHEKFVAECIDSAIKQITDFTFEILIGVDLCEDKTHEICLSFQEKYPDKVKVFLNEPSNVLYVNGNRVGRFNFLNVFRRATGKYIAICDGDDYWCDPLKLQKQVDILENHPESAACHHWHYFSIPDENGVYHVTDAPIVNQGYLPDEVAGLREVFANKIRIKSRTVMYRNLYEPLPEVFNQVAFGDIALSVIYGLRGNFRFINEPMAVYRQTGKGVSSSGREHKNYVLKHYLDYIDLWEKCDVFCQGVHRKEALETIDHFYENILKNYKYRFAYLIQCLKYSLFRSGLSKGLRIKISLGIIKKYLQRPRSR